MFSTHLYGRVALGFSFTAASLLLASCANFNTIGRTNKLPGGDVTVMPYGKAIHLDAPQRLAYVNALGKMCAEPSPDALQAYAASLTGSFTAPSKESASVAAALSASSASFGLRTQSITLMRDAMYRICEAYHNNALNELDVLQLMQRSQDLTLGILAIEQLTGAVVARQVALGTNANVAPVDTDKLVAGFDAANKAEGAKKDALESKTEAAGKAKETAEKAAKDSDAADKKAKEIAAAIKKQQALTDAETAKQKVVDAAVAAAADEATLAKAKAAQAEQKTKTDKAVADLKKLTDDTAAAQATTLATELKAKLEELKKAEAAAKSAKTEYDDAQKVTGLRRTALTNAATGQVSASGSGTFSDAYNRGSIDSDAVAHIAASTNAIVDSVLTKGRMTDTCANMMTAAFKNPGIIPFVQTLLEQCGRVVDTYLRVYEAALTPVVAPIVAGDVVAPVRPPAPAARGPVVRVPPPPPPAPAPQVFVAPPAPTPALPPRRVAPPPAPMRPE